MTINTSTASFAAKKLRQGSAGPHFWVYTLARKLDVLLYVRGRVWRGTSFLERRLWRFDMAYARTPVRVIYACGLVIAASILFLMIYSGVLEGVGEAIFDFVKEIVKFFIG
jgi:hypothetical protein